LSAVDDLPAHMRGQVTFKGIYLGLGTCAKSELIEVQLYTSTASY